MTRKRTTPATHPTKTTARRRTAPAAAATTQRNASPLDKPRRGKAVTTPPASAAASTAPRAAARPTVNEAGISPAVASRSTSSKQARLIDLLRSTEGADIAQMIAVTGWQPHSVRGAISGVLRKKLGLTVVCQADAAGIRRYRIVDAASV